MLQYGICPFFWGEAFWASFWRSGAAVRIQCGSSPTSVPHTLTWFAISFFWDWALSSERISPGVPPHQADASMKYLAYKAVSTPSSAPNAPVHALACRCLRWLRRKGSLSKNLTTVKAPKRLFVIFFRAVLMIWAHWPAGLMTTVPIPRPFWRPAWVKAVKVGLYDTRQTSTSFRLSSFPPPTKEELLPFKQG